MEIPMTTTRRVLVRTAIAAGASALLVMLLASSGDADQETRQGPGVTMTIEQNNATARRWSEELWGQGHLAVADEIIAADYVRHDPGDPFPARGPADVKRIVTMLRGMLPDLTLQIESMVTENDMVVSRYTATATDTVGYMGMPPTGKVIRTSAMQMFRFANGKIVESWAVRDDLGTFVSLAAHQPCHRCHRVRQPRPTAPERAANPPGIRRSGGLWRPAEDVDRRGEEQTDRSRDRTPDDGRPERPDPTEARIGRIRRIEFDQNRTPNLSRRPPRRPAPNRIHVNPGAPRILAP
jgi:predicted SnoaL-like aldol condensation-catalyzing enzyme